MRRKEQKFQEGTEQEIINGYELIGKLNTDNSGFSKWGFAWKDEKQFFIKEFISPVYPAETAGLEPRLMEKKKEICRKYEVKQKLLYESINQCTDGNLVRIEHFFRYGSKYYITMKKIVSTSLDEIRAAPWFNQEVKVRLCKILLHSLLALHNQGIVHGDIKMDNILFQLLPAGNLTAKIIDFDNCFWEDKPPAPTEEIHGDMVYMAPETFKMMDEEQGTLTSAIDVFALGLIFYNIFTGKLPQVDKSKYDYPFEALLSGDRLVGDAGVPAEYQELITRMLETSPEKRITLKEAAGYFYKGYPVEEAVKTAVKTDGDLTIHMTKKQPSEYFRSAGDL